MLRKYLPPNVPFVEAFHKGGKQTPTAIVIKSSNTTSRTGAALGRATMWHKRNSPKQSFHYIVDESKAYRCVPDKTVAFHSGEDSRGAIGINICFDLLLTLDDWDDRTHSNVLQKTAELVAQLVLAHKIPVRFLTAKEVSRWRKHKWRSRGGIIVLILGAWPMDTFKAEVESQIAELKSK